MPTESRPIRVLVADDEPLVLAAVVAVLGTDPDIEVVAQATDADEAIVLAQQIRPDIALLDVAMPSGGGVRATRDIKASVSSTRIVGFSGSDERSELFGMLGAGADAYLVKGSSPDELISALHRLVAGEGTLSPDVTGEVIDELARELGRREQADTALREKEGQIRSFLDGEGLSIAFQPLVRLNDEQVVGVEALARFACQPYRPPNIWFEEAEEVGLRDELELRAIRLALDRIDELPEAAYLSVNLSPSIVAREEIAGWIEPLAERVQLEITEHTIVEDYPLVKETLDALRAHGVRVAVDDAGAGFASLRHILRLDPNQIKMDMSLTRDAPDQPRVRALASALVAFAREVGCEMLAEGIETQRELEALRDLGVDFGQGYLLGRPAALP